MLAPRIKPRWLTRPPLRAVNLKAARAAGLGSLYGTRVGALAAVLGAPKRPVAKQDGKLVAEP